MMISVSMSDFRELPVWKQARLLALAGHELSHRLQLDPAAQTSSNELQNGCVALLTAIVNRYEGQEWENEKGSSDSVERALARLDALLADGLRRGSVQQADYLLLHKTIINVKELL